MMNDNWALHMAEQEDGFPGVTGSLVRRTRKKSIHIPIEFVDGRLKINFDPERRTVQIHEAINQPEGTLPEKLVFNQQIWEGSLGKFKQLISVMNQFNECVKGG